MKANSQDQTPKPTYEVTDAKAWPIWIVGGGLVLSVAFTILCISVMYGWLHHRDLARQRKTQVDRVTTAVAETRHPFPEPRLQVAPQVDLATLRAREEGALHSYGWVDPKAGIVRLPIERAMDLIAQRGLSVRGDPTAPKPTLTPLEMQQSRPVQRQPVSEAPLQEVK